MQEPPDEELVARAKAGDEHAFRMICDRHVGLVEHRIRRHVRGDLLRKLDVADVVQEVLLTAHQRLDAFEVRHAGSLGGWLATIAELKAREAVRHYVATDRRGIGREVSPGHRPPTDAFAGPDRSPSQIAMAAEEREGLVRAIDGLPEDYATVLRLVVGRQLSLDEASQALGRSYEATKKLYGRALTALTERMRGPDDGEGRAPGT